MRPPSIPSKEKACAEGRDIAASDAGCAAAPVARIAAATATVGTRIAKPAMSPPRDAARRAARQERGNGTGGLRLSALRLQRRLTGPHGAQDAAAKPPGPDSECDVEPHRRDRTGREPYRRGAEPAGAREAPGVRLVGAPGEGLARGPGGVPEVGRLRLRGAGMRLGPFGPAPAAPCGSGHAVSPWMSS